MTRMSFGAPQMRRLRAAALLALLAWFFLPELQNAIPIWLPFLAVESRFELNFLVTGLREEPLRSRRGSGPQEVDLADFGGDAWLEPVLVQIDRPGRVAPGHRQERRGAGGS